MRVGELRQGAEGGGCAEGFLCRVTHTPEMVNSCKPLWWSHLQVCQWVSSVERRGGVGPSSGCNAGMSPHSVLGVTGSWRGNTATEPVDGPRLNNPTR